MKKTLIGLVVLISMLCGFILSLKYGLILDYGTPEKQAETHAELFFRFGKILFLISSGYFLFFAIKIIFFSVVKKILLKRP